MPYLLPPDEARRVLESICEQNRAFYSDRRGIGALKDLQQTFPNSWLYVAELLQNAVDAEASRIHVAIQEDGTVVFEHNGKGFSAQDVEALCARGVSAKGANTVGFMGIGFKSVFRSFERVQVFSGSWRFRLTVAIRQLEEYGDQQRDWLGAVLPCWDESADEPSPGMTCRFVLSNRLPELQTSANDLECVLGENKTLLALLAWQNVKELKWNGKSWLLERHESPLDAQGDLRVLLESLDDAGNACRRWLLFSKSYQPSRKAIARFLEHRQIVPLPNEKEKVYSEASKKRQVAVFFEIGDGGAPIPLDRGSAFALLPTGVTFPIGLHVQADWLLVVTRREIMQLEGNEWHEEILDQLPCLLRYYLEWLVNARGNHWNRGYEALPGQPSEDREGDRWFVSQRCLDALRLALETLAFLPTPPSEDGSITFLQPSEGRILPKPFTKVFEDATFFPRALFGDHIVSSHLLGARARQCLERLTLLSELTAQELVDRGTTGAVKIWLELFPEDERHQKLIKLLDALGEMNANPDWKDAPLLCLPTVSGDWTHRATVSRYPADWDILAQEDEIRAALQPHVGSEAAILTWDLDRLVQQTRSPARDYLESITSPKFESVVLKWWEHLPQSLTPDQVAIILRMTAWVREKQPQRKGLVRRLLCLTGEDRLELRETENSLLSAPYAGEHRDFFFPGVPRVAPDYASHDAMATQLDWRSFLESLDPPPCGRFTLYTTSRLMQWRDFRAFMGDGYSPPGTRTKWLEKSCDGHPVRSSWYTVMDTVLPKEIRTPIVQGTITQPQFSAIAQWMAESPSFFRSYPSLILAYIPSWQWDVTKESLPRPPQWRDDLANNAWVYGRNAEGPFCPRDILPSPDPARPDIQVADLPKELIDALQDGGIQFGANLPDAPAVDRLRIQGPTASAVQLLEFLQAAIDEVGDDENKREFLRETLRESRVFPLPPDSAAVDGSARVTHGRVVRNERGRSLLGNWLVAIDSFDEGSSERRLLELADSFLPVPKNTSFTQVLDFLAWAWSATPDADSVRRLLPRAYQYVNEEIENDDSLLEQWRDILPDARIFVQNKRRWVPLSGASALFLADLNEADLGDVLSSVDLATPGHLGDSGTDQVAVANLLGVPLLSSRFRVEFDRKNEQTVPEHWQEGFGALQSWLRGQLGTEDEVDAESGAKGVPSNNVRLSRWQVLRKVVCDSGKPVQTKEVKASAAKDGTIAISGTPDEFAEELCQALFTQWGLSLRRDLVKLIPRVAIQLTRIGDPSIVAGWLSGNALDSGGTLPSAEGIPPTPPPAVSKKDDQPTGGREPTGQPGEPKPVPQRLGARQSSGGSYTAEDREARNCRVVEKIIELNRQLQEGLAADVFPIEDEEERPKTGEFRTDEPYRHAAMKYEQEADPPRFPEAKGATQEGHDIDSYTHPEGHPDRRLIKRIEVKGRSTRWDSNEVVELSNRQFKDAMRMVVPDGAELAEDFDYWLYVVETDDSGVLRVVPIRNVASRTAHFGFRGGAWRHMIEKESRTLSPPTGAST